MCGLVVLDLYSRIVTSTTNVVLHTFVVADCILLRCDVFKYKNVKCCINFVKHARCFTLYR